MQESSDSIAPNSPLSKTETRVWKLTLCYDGSPFAGWQVQPGRRTVQGELSDAIERVIGERMLPQGSGRTDAGVHALAQVASVALRSPIPPENLLRALNHKLLPAIRVLAAEHAAPGFHARHSAVHKTYEYRLWRPELCPPWLAPYVCAYTFPLDLAPMCAAASAVIGTHDFASFQAHEPDKAARTERLLGDAQSPAGSGGDQPGLSAPAGDVSGETLLREPAPRSTVRTILRSEWQEREPGLLVYTVCGTGFLHHMVRNLVGTFLQVGRSQLRAADVSTILEARTRSAAGPTAPASGLWLHSVQY